MCGSFATNQATELFSGCFDDAYILFGNNARCLYLHYLMGVFQKSAAVSSMDGVVAETTVAAPSELVPASNSAQDNLQKEDISNGDRSGMELHYCSQG